MAGAYAEDAAARVRTLLRLDAAFELALAAVLLCITATGLHDDLGLPAPVSAAVIAIFGVVLMPVGVVLWLMSRAQTPPRRTSVAGLAAANDLGAAILLLWLVLAIGDCGVGGAVLVGATAVGLATLALGEWLALRDRSGTHKISPLEPGHTPQ
jgi:hypothetical protein